ncbi:MAG: AIR synthase related protein, partial [Gemmatimonadota bacterium]
VWEQYDHTVQASTVAAPGADAAIVRIRGTDRGLALAVDGNGRWVYCDPRRGSALAVAEAARNLAAVGARPLAVTDCLNFGNPQKDPVYWQFVQSIRGISDACRALDTPVVSGNVSFYNESARGAIHPTPTVGMVGVVDLEHAILPGRGRPGDLVLLAGGEGSHLGATSLLEEVVGRTGGQPPAVDLDAERRLGDAVRELAEGDLVRSAHDISDGGLAVAAAELLFAHPPETGLDLELPAGADPVKALFGEDAARILLVIAPEDEVDATRRLSAHRLPVRVAARLTAAPVFRILGLGDRARPDLEALWEGTIPRIMQRTESSR